MPSLPPRRPLFTPQERIIFLALAQIARRNPYLPDRIEHEHQALGPFFVFPGPIMTPGPDPRVSHHNIRALTILVQRILPAIRDRYKAGAEVSDADRATYIAVCLFFLYDTVDTQLQAMITAGSLAAPFYDEHEARYTDYLGFLTPAADIPDVAHVFAIFYQIRRAYYYLHIKVCGRSLAMGRLRARIWAAIFGADLSRYALSLWTRMPKLSTLIQGPSGSGKELVAESIGRSGYVPFDAGTQTFEAHGDYYTGVNLLGFSTGLLESELFGHRQGAFTGAIRNKIGVFESLPRFGALLLDEVAEIDPRMQVQLLRVLQERVFRRVGDEGPLCELRGRLLTATHRDLGACLASGVLREDFFRRICMHKIVTPSLRERFDESPGEIRDLVAFLLVDSLDPEGDARRDASVVDEVEAFVAKHLPHHPWTGNIRELQQCVWDVQTIGEYLPEKMIAGRTLEQGLADSGLHVDEIIRRYAVSARERLGNDADAARLLGVNVPRLKRILASAPPAPRRR